MPIEEGMIVDGVVANITKFGAFVQLSGGENRTCTHFRDC